MKAICTGLVALAVSTAAFAQEPYRVKAVAEGQPTRFIPLCNLDAKKDAKKADESLRKALEDRKKRTEKLAESRTLALKAIGADPSSGAGWYILGRLYLYDGDVIGADSALAAAEKYLPGCKADIENTRFSNWATMANAANALHGEKKTDEAMKLYRIADHFYSGKPTVAANLGAIYWERGEMDSAAVYFAKAYKIVSPPDAKPGNKTDSSAARPKDARAARAESLAVAERNNIAQSLAIIYDQLNRSKDALPILEKLVVWLPNNVDIRKLYASSLRKEGQNAKADSIEKMVVGELAKKNSDSLPFQDLLVIGANAYNSKQYAQAEDAFRAALKKNQYSWDAAMNLATTLFAAKEYKKLTELEAQLTGIAPFNETVYKLVGSAHNNLKNMQGAISAAEKLFGLLVNIDSVSMRNSKEGATFKAKAFGRDGQDPSGRSYPPRPIKLVVEFMSADGKVIDSKEVTIPALKVGEKFDLLAEGKGANIAGWRYREATAD